MRHALLLLLSTMLFLFTQAQPQKAASGLACALKSELKVADNYLKHNRPCAKKCLKHQTHSEQKDAANVPIDCGQQLYAVISDLQTDAPYSSGTKQQFILSVQRIYLPPNLGTEPDPPRFS